LGIDDWIMHELAEHGDGLHGSSCMGGTQGVADAEAHAVMGG
jgi:hypothetical protein